MAVEEFQLPPFTLPGGGVLRLSGTLTPSTAPDPDPDPDPATWASVTIGTSPPFPIAAINPPSSRITSDGKAYQGGRGPDELIVVTAPATVSLANYWGAEASVDPSGVVRALSDRQTTRAPIGMGVPPEWRVLSGHGKARDWLLRWAKAGSVVTWSADPAPDDGEDPGNPVPSGTYPTRAISIYKMMYGNSPAFRLNAAPAECNVARLAFAVANPPRMVGWGPEGEATLLSDVAAWTDAGKRVVISYGGSGQPTSTSDRAAFLSGVKAIRESYGGNIHGWDWDIETGGQTEEDLVYLSLAMKDTYGPDWSISFTPGDIDLYLRVAARLAAVGALDEYGQQFYDAVVTQSALLWRLDQAVAAGIPPERLSVGMMIQAGSPKHWTNQQCVDNFAAARSKYPGITKAYLWEGSRSGTRQWAADMARVAAS